MKQLALVAVTLVLVTAPVDAAVVDITEGNRAQVAGTTAIGDAAGSSPGYDLGDLSLGDSVAVHGRLVNGVDYFNFSSDSAVEIEWIFGGYDLEGGGSVSESGFIREGSAGSNTALITLGGDASGSMSFTTPVTSGDPGIFTVGAGNFTLSLDGGGGAALYDFRITAVPLPAAAWLFGSALLGFASIARRRGHDSAA